MVERDKQAPETEVITGAIEFCGDEIAELDPWQRLFETCLHYQEIAKQRAAASTAATI